MNIFINVRVHEVLKHVIGCYIVYFFLSYAGQGIQNTMECYNENTSKMSFHLHPSKTLLRLRLICSYSQLGYYFVCFNCEVQQPSVAKCVISSENAGIWVYTTTCRWPRLLISDHGHIIKPQVCTLYVLDKVVGVQPLHIMADIYTIWHWGIACPLAHGLNIHFWTLKVTKLRNRLHEI